MNNEDQLYLFDEDGGGGASVSKEQDDRLGVERLSPDHPVLYLPLGFGLKYKVRQCLMGSIEQGRNRRKPAEMVQGLAVRDGRPVLSGLWNRAHPVLHFSRRDDKLRIQNGWLYHLAPEIIRQLSPDTEEDKLPFSKHSDVFALG